LENFSLDLPESWNEGAASEVAVLAYDGIALWLWAEKKAILKYEI